jgi:cytosine permease
LSPTPSTPGWRVEALGAWGLATGIAAWMQAQQMSVTTIPALDSLLLSIVAYAVLRRLVARRLPVNTQSQS